MLYSFYFENDYEYDLIESLDIVLKMYNNHIHTTTKYSSNEIFFQNLKNYIKKTLLNKNNFKSIGKTFKNFSVNELALLNTKFLFKKKYNNKKPGYSIFNRLKNKKINKKINAVIIRILVMIIKYKLKKIIQIINLKKMICI